MNVPSVRSTFVYAAAIGVASHLGYFIHGEHHKYSDIYAAVFALIPVLIYGGLSCVIDNASFSVVGITTAIATFSYFAGLITSILTYRAFFHPLRKFPGPFAYKLSKFAQFMDVMHTLDNFLQCEELRQKYGDYVRIGPNELLVFTPEGMTAIGGAGSKCIKAPWYDGGAIPIPTLHTTRDRAIHDKRRKIWDRGFSAKALRSYERRVAKYSDELMKQLKTNSGKPIDASLWLIYYSFDVMGEFAFGKSFDMIKNGQRHKALKLLSDGLDAIGMFRSIHWVVPIFYRVPGILNAMKTFDEFCWSQVTARKQNEPTESDVMSWLIDAEKSSSDPIMRDARWTLVDSKLIIVAGSDTTATTLTHITYHIAKNPQIAVKLREELEELKFHPGSETEFRDIQDAKYLNGIINEALRMHPPVPSGLLRQTPSEGINIEGTYIPGGVTVSSPLYSMGRLESSFPRSNEFIPERWGEKPELVVDKAAFAPFSTGVYACVGKQLALMELRSVITRLVLQFDISFAPGEDGTNLITKSKDCFTMDMAPLNIIFTERK